MRPGAPWAIIHVPLDEPLAGIGRPAGAEAVQLIFRRGGAVLGYANLLPGELPIGAGELARLAAWAIAPALATLTLGERFARQLALPPGAAPPPKPASAAQAGGGLAEFDRLVADRRRPSARSVTVAICTRRRPGPLRGCLAAVAEAIGAAGREILVVDNGPDAETRAVAEAAGARYVQEPLPGLSRARNAALANARGEIVAFVDDDVTPEPGWLEPLLHAFEDPRVGIATGLALPARLDTEAQIAFQLDLGFGGMDLAPGRFDADFLAATRHVGAPVWKIGAGANMAVRRSLGARIGGFDPRLGPGAAGGAGDDSEFWRRALEAGIAAQYEPFSVVRHLHREAWAELERQAVGYALGHLAALFAQFGRHRSWGDLRRAFLYLPAYYAYRIVLAPRRRMLGKSDPLLWSAIRGYLRGLRHLPFAFGAPDPEPLPVAEAADPA